MMNIVGTLSGRSRRLKAKTFGVASLLVVLASCTSAKEGPPPPTAPGETSPTVAPVEPVSDFGSFVSRLESDGHTIRRVDGGTWLDRYFGTRGRLISIDGAKVYTFEYPTVAAADKLRSSVSKTGHTIYDDKGREAALIDWVSHFHSSGRLIVVFVGSRQRMIRTLDELLGPQFAGV
jgi:hypothetical protein